MRRYFGRWWTPSEGFKERSSEPSSVGGTVAVGITPAPRRTPQCISETSEERVKELCNQ